MTGPYFQARASVSASAVFLAAGVLTYAWEDFSTSTALWMALTCMFFAYGLRQSAVVRRRIEQERWERRQTARIRSWNVTKIEQGTLRLSPVPAPFTGLLLAEQARKKPDRLMSHVIRFERERSRKA